MNPKKGGQTKIRKNCVIKFLHGEKTMFHFILVLFRLMILILYSFLTPSTNKSEKERQTNFLR
jgi:hypothetical protein